MTSDFKNWYLENSTFFDRLHGHDSILFNHVKDIIDSLAYIVNMNEEDINEDIEEIFDMGYSYLYTYVSELQTYLKNYFKDNFTDFLKYDLILSFNLYVNDLKELLVKKDVYNNDIREDLEYVMNKSEDIIQNQLEINEDLINEFNQRIETLTIYEHNNDLLTTPEVFADVVDKLGI